MYCDCRHPACMEMVSEEREQPHDALLATIATAKTRGWTVGSRHLAPGHSRKQP